MHTGRKLQLIKRALLADHVPVCLEVCTNTYVASHRNPPELDRDALMRCVTKGFKRQQFVEFVEQKIAEYPDAEEYKNAMARNSPTKL